MLDFLLISTRSCKGGAIEIYPKFIVKKSEDLMIRGGDFYAIWVEDRGLWSTDEQDAINLIDRELDEYANENKAHFSSNYKVLHMWDSETGMIDAWHRYCQRHLRDNFCMLDSKLIFSNSGTNKKDYASKRLPYPLENCDTPAWDKLISTLYSDTEREKIEWAIGAIVCGASQHLQKFEVLYGAAGTGKSTILNIIQKLFEGYFCVFDAKALGSSSNSFALEAFKGNPLVAIQHDGDLSRIEDNTRINSLVSHELMTVNEKFKSTYPNRFKCFLFMGTNKPVKITDAKSGLIRRLIDVTPSGNKLPAKEYETLVKKVNFELGGIAYHCKDIFESNPDLYNDYVPVSMLNASNDFYNFIMDSYLVFKNEGGTTLKAAWEMYKNYCDDAKVPYPFSQRVFKEELKNYFKNYQDRSYLEDGTRVRNYYSDFKIELMQEERPLEREQAMDETIPDWLQLKSQHSLFDDIYKSIPAQYASSYETPKIPWSENRSVLSDLDTSRVHYVNIPENHIVIDFDIRGEDGAKDAEQNLKAASKWPKTYAEFSKSGGGLHLHYIYTGDPEKLCRVYDENIEIKVYTGDQALRRKLTKCNDIPISNIGSGLPLKGDGNKVVNFKAIRNEKSIRRMIKRNLNKEYHDSTASSVSFIKEILDQAHNSGMHYDVTDMRNAILTFAAKSTHQANNCIRLVNKMQFKSDDISENDDNSDAPIVFYDVEVFPNLFLVNWKVKGKGKQVVRMINPSPSEISELVKYRLIGFNCRRYDNHMLYARMIGYSVEQLYTLSKRIIGKSKNCFFGEAYNLSYTDVYDFASAGNKKSLKKLEIEMGIHHQELGLPWDEPVPEELWPKVAEYCDNDVIATEAAFEHLKADWLARQILADLAGMTVNDTTNSLTTRIIFGRERNPQKEFHYRNLAEPVTELDEDSRKFLTKACPKMMEKEHTVNGTRSILPFFPGYEFKGGKSTYMGVEVGEGGRVYAEPGMYWWVALLDIASQHPHSAIAEVLFGPRFTTVFRDIVEGRVSIKHEAWSELNDILDGKLLPYIERVKSGEFTSRDLANALKTAINSVYGLTDASFDNAFRDARNIDNIVAKRGALFMVNLEHEVKARGFTVAHVKTDSIKIPNATPEIIKFVMDYGERYGYTFEHEATYERMCLVNNAVYIAKFASAEKCRELYGYIPGKNAAHSKEWTATGKQFAVPYVFKTLFSKEKIEFEDLCVTQEVQTALYLDTNEHLPDVTDLETKADKLKTELRKHRKALNRSDCTTESTSIIQQQIDTLTDQFNTLDAEIQKGHEYRFIGKVGLFCPIKSGCGGGWLVRESVDTATQRKSYSSATGAKNYRWLESEMVKNGGKENDIDLQYHNDMVNEAVETISKFGDFDEFVSDDVPDITVVSVAPWVIPELYEDTAFCVR